MDIIFYDDSDIKLFSEITSFNASEKMICCIVELL